jgi:carboxymethylenebutenolidase
MGIAAAVLSFCLTPWRPNLMQLNNKVSSQSAVSAATHSLISSEMDSLVPAIKLSRRGFIAGSTAAGFAAAVVPTGNVLAQVVKTDSVGLDTGDVKIRSGDTELAAYFAKPAGRTDCPTIHVVQEIFGVHEYIKDTCRRFAKEGYLAIAVELFQRQGDPKSISNIPEIVSNIVSKVPDAQVMADLDAATAWATRNGGDTNKLAITGFCWGGRVVWLYAAHNKNLRAGIAWYGRLTGPTSPTTPSHPYDIAASLNGPVLGLYGGADSGIPESTVQEMSARLSVGNAASKASGFAVYPDTPHAFHADYRPSYRKEAAQDGWRRTLEWLSRHGVTAQS